MPHAPIPEDEDSRLSSIQALGALEEPSPVVLQDIVDIAAQVCDTPMAAVTFVGAQHQWVKAAVGLEVGAGPRDEAFCAYTILKDEILVVEDARLDSRFSDNPAVTGGPQVRFYAGAPLRLPDGAAAGALCVVDRVPRTLSKGARKALSALRRQAETTLALRIRERQLADANEQMSFRQKQRQMLVQFAVHDMRSSLSAIRVNSDYLANCESTLEQVSEIGSDLQEAVAALARLLDDLMDISANETEAHIRVTTSEVTMPQLERALKSKFLRRLSHSAIRLAVELDDSVAIADSTLLNRILDNLFDNALRSSPSGGTITLSSSIRGSDVMIVVADEGAGVPVTERNRIFDLYHQGSSGGWRGLGLAFCKLAAEAMNGRIWVEPRLRAGSRFCLTLPRALHVA